MALWGNKDTVYSTGTISVDLSTKVATVSSGPLPAAADLEGAVLTVTGKGSAVIKERLTSTTFSIINTTGLDGTAISGVTYNISEQPVYLNEDSNWGGNEVYGVDETEVSVARTATVSSGGIDKAGGFAVAHSGWVAVATTYIDSNNRLRVKSEVLVAMGGTMGANDSLDDAVFPDAP